MAGSPTSPIDVAFLSGYVLHAMRTIFDELGEIKSGFGNFYAVRVLETHRPINDYDVTIANYAMQNWPGSRVLSVGVGLATLEILLACNGVTVGAVESDELRAASARRLRGEVIKTWPIVADCLTIIEGLYPDATEATHWGDKDTVLVFTNIGASWDDALTTRIIDTMPRFGHVLVDLWRLGPRRDDVTERNAIFERIAAKARGAMRLPFERLTNYDFARFDF